MIKNNRDKSSVNINPDREFRKKYDFFISITLALLAFLICSYILFTSSQFITSINYFCPFRLIIYILHNCLLGLVIGCAISYGLQQNKYVNKNVLFILILLCAFYAYCKYNPWYNYISIKALTNLLVHYRSLNILYFFLVALGIGGFISHRGNKDSNLSFILIILCSVITYLTISRYYKIPWELYNGETGIKLYHLCIIYLCFLSLVIREAILKMKESRYSLKQILFIVVPLFSLLAYLTFGIVDYLISPGDFRVLGIWNFLLYKLKSGPGPALGYLPGGVGHFQMYSFSDTSFMNSIIRFFNVIIPGKLDSSVIIIIITIQVWIVEFIITLLCSWGYIMFVFGFQPLALFNRDNKSQTDDLNKSSDNHNINKVGCNMEFKDNN